MAPFTGHTMVQIYDLRTHQIQQAIKGTYLRGNKWKIKDSAPVWWESRPLFFFCLFYKRGIQLPALKPYTWVELVGSYLYILERAMYSLIHVSARLWEWNFYLKKQPWTLFISQSLLAQRRFDQTEKPSRMLLILHIILMFVLSRLQLLCVCVCVRKSALQSFLKEFWESRA